MSTTDKKLFDDFDAISKEAWKEKAVTDLKGADFDRKLVWQTDNGFPVEPFYTPIDLDKVPEVDALHNVFASSGRKWTNYIEIDADDVKSANQKAQKALQFGASGLLFRLNHPDQTDFGVLMKGIDAEKIQVSFRLEQASNKFVSSYLNFLKSENIDLNHINGFVDADVLEQWITKGIDPDYGLLVNMTKQSAEAPGLKTLVVHSDAFLNAGSSNTQELGYTLNKVAEYIDRFTDAGIAAADVSAKLLMHITVGGDYFAEIAKFRALRVALQSVLQCYDIEHVKVPVLATNAYWSKSLYDPYVNLLRNTTEAMSAILGGSDAILINPHDQTFGTTTDFSHRIALNISNLIEHEAYFDKVIDPAAGSYYIENLTINMTENALELFSKTENAGGFVKAFNANIIQDDILDIKTKKDKESATRKRVYVGTNKYPNLKEQVPYKNLQKNGNAKKSPALLVPKRMTEPFEAIRQKTQKHFEATGKLPEVFLACFGNPAMRTARAMFAAEFFGIAGFSIAAEKVFESAEAAAKESAGSQADIVVICASDQDYEADATTFAKSFKSIDDQKELVLAGFPQNIIEDLKNAGVDHFIHMKTNAIETLQQLQDKFKM